MNGLFLKACLLVTAAFVLTLVPGLRRREGSLLSVHDGGSALLVFLALGLVEEASAWHTGWFNARIVAVCAAGLVAGPWVGLTVGVCVTWLAVGHDGLPWGSIGVSMLAGGLAGGWLHRYRPRWACWPVTGFGLTLAISYLRDGLLHVGAPGAHAALQTFPERWFDPFLQGLGTALVLAVMAEARDRDDQVRLAAAAEVRALQVRMNPHFLCNALNALAARAVVTPRDIPRAVGRLRHFLRASFDQPERPWVPLQDELAVVEAYLEVEAMRFGNRLRVEATVDPGLARAPVPPFSLQPLVENAVQHGLQPSPGAGRLRVAVRRIEDDLELSVTDDGHGVARADVERVFFGTESRVRALGLLRRRLQGLYGGAFRLTVRSDLGQGTTVTVRMPLQRRAGRTDAAPDFPLDREEVLSR